MAGETAGAEPGTASLRAISGWPGYLAGDDGRIYSIRGGKSAHALAPSRGSSGYQHVNLCDGSGAHSRLVHLLIAEAFHGPRPPGFEASHRDGDQSNNRPGNLIWESRAENFARKREHGTLRAGLDNSRSVMTGGRLERVREFIASGHTNKAIAAAIGVSPTTVSRVRSGRRYASDGLRVEAGGSS